MTTVYNLLICGNGLWFSAGFYFFCLRSNSAAHLIINRRHTDEKTFHAVAYSLKFLGGLNLAFAILSLLIILQPGLFPETAQKIAILSILALAHATQFLLNVPQVLKERRNRNPLWPVLTGTMFFIFVTDGALFIFNVLCALMLQ
jgi:hypothetical protein